jgi:prepilin-type N-terminal cleavage/methylation domain-containing protein
MTKDELEQCLKQLGLSQTEAGQLLGVAPRTVRRWLSEEDIPSPIAQLLETWCFLHQRHLPWGPHSVMVMEDDLEGLSLERARNMNIEGMVARVQFRGGARLPWDVNVKKHYAELGAMRVSFITLPDGAFLLTSYRRTDQEPNAARDREFIEDAAWCISRALEEDKVKSGFTLLEISIVLTILALLVGGVLVGQDMILAGKIKQQIAQFEKYSTAVNTFKMKYNGLPGDLVNAVSYGFVTRTGAAYHGDGSNVIDTCIPTADTLPLGCERNLFWSDLSKANLIEGTFSGSLDGAPTINTFLDSVNYFPRTKLDDKITLVVANDTGGDSWFRMIQINQYAGGISSFHGQILVSTAATMDTKMDDGKPLTGNMQIKGNGFVNPVNSLMGSPTSGNGWCVNNSAYNITQGSGAAFCYIAAKMMY